MRTETVEVTVDGSAFTGDLTGPPGGSDHAAVLLPGANHGPYGDVFDRLAEAAADGGVDFLRYETWKDGEELESKGIEGVTAEYDAAVAHLSDRGYARITTVGKSFGGRIALQHVPEAVDDMVLWAPAAFLAGGSAIEAIDPPEDVELPTITPAEVAAVDEPVAILQGDEDKFPVENARELAAELPRGSVHLIEGADHSFVGDGEDETIETTRSLLDREVEN